MNMKPFLHQDCSAVSSAQCGANKNAMLCIQKRWGKKTQHPFGRYFWQMQLKKGYCRVHGTFSILCKPPCLDIRWWRLCVVITTISKKESHTIHQGNRPVSLGPRPKQQLGWMVGGKAELTLATTSAKERTFWCWRPWGIGSQISCQIMRKWCSDAKRRTSGHPKPCGQPMWNSSEKRRSWPWNRNLKQTLSSSCPLVSHQAEDEHDPLWWYLMVMLQQTSLVSTTKYHMACLGMIFWVPMDPITGLWLQETQFSSLTQLVICVDFAHGFQAI